MQFKLTTFVLLALLLLNGCAVTPIPDSSWVSIPEIEKAGVYFYQQKTGIFGSLYDVSLYIDDEKLGEINTGEWLYFEVPPGKHTYDLNAGQLISNPIPVEFESGNNYFFRGFITMGSAHVVLIKNHQEIKYVANKIKSGWYEFGEKDQ